MELDVDYGDDDGDDGYDDDGDDGDDGEAVSCWKHAGVVGCRSLTVRIQRSLTVGIQRHEIYVSMSALLTCRVLRDPRFCSRGSFSSRFFWPPLHCVPKHDSPNPLSLNPTR